MENDPNEVGKQTIKNCEPLKNVIFDPGAVWGGSAGRIWGKSHGKVDIFPRLEKKSFFRFGPKIWRARNFEPGYLRAQKELGDKQDI